VNSKKSTYPIGFLIPNIGVFFFSLPYVKAMAKE
jgi:hypothetical protein